MNKDWTSVSKETALDFIKNYPVKLEHNFFMDSHSWHDFSNKVSLQNSLRVMADINYDSDQLNWRIKTEYLK